MGGLAIFKAEPTADGGIVADRRLFRTNDNRIVEAGDSDAAYLLVAGAGSTIPVDEVKALRLEVKNGRVEQAEPDPNAPADQGAVTDAGKDALAVGLKVAADERRKADLGKGQTQVALTEAPAVDETAAGRARARHEADAKPVAETPTAKPAQKGKGK